MGFSASHLRYGVTQGPSDGICPQGSGRLRASRFPGPSHMYLCRYGRSRSGSFSAEAMFVAPYADAQTTGPLVLCRTVHLGPGDVILRRSRHAKSGSRSAAVHAIRLSRPKSRYLSERSATGDGPIGTIAGSDPGYSTVAIQRRRCRDDYIRRASLQHRRKSQIAFLTWRAMMSSERIRPTRL